MKRPFLATIALLAALAVVPAQQAEAGTYPLWKAEAEDYMRIGLKRQLGNNFTMGYRHRITCRKRIARDRRRCRIYWLLGDSIYRGFGKIWMTYPGGRAYWNYGFRLRRINSYCRSEGRTNCVKVISRW